LVNACSHGRKWKSASTVARTVGSRGGRHGQLHQRAIPHSLLISVRKTRVKLSFAHGQRAASVDHRVTVTLYYDRKDDFYPDIVAFAERVSRGESENFFYHGGITFAMPVEAEKIEGTLRSCFVHGQKIW